TPPRTAFAAGAVATPPRRVSPQIADLQGGEGAVCVALATKNAPSVASPCGPAGGRGCRLAATRTRLEPREDPAPPPPSRVAAIASRRIHPQELAAHP